VVLWKGIWHSGVVDYVGLIGLLVLLVFLSRLDWFWSFGLSLCFSNSVYGVMRIVFAV